MLMEGGVIPQKATAKGIAMTQAGALELTRVTEPAHGGESVRQTGRVRVREDGLDDGCAPVELMGPSTLGSLIDRDDLLAVARWLPPLPPVERRLRRLLSLPDDDVDAASLVECIAHDPALAVAVLRRANEQRAPTAVAGGDPGPVGDLDEGLAVIGRDGAIETARRALSVADCTPSTGASYGTIGDDLWRHSVMAKLAAELILEEAGSVDRGEVVTAALIHDIGKLLLCRYLTPNIVHLLRLAAGNDGLSEFEAELEVLQAHHGEVGALVLGAWDLPFGTLLAVQYHHTPDIGFDRACFIVGLADVVAHDLASGVALGFAPRPAAGGLVRDGDLDDDDERSRLRTELLGELDIDPEAYGAVVRTVAARFTQLSRRFEAS